MKNFKLLLISLLLIFTSSCDPFNNIIEKDSPEDTIKEYTAKNIITPADKDTLNVVSWNIKFGGGRIDFFFDCWGDRVLMTEAEVMSNMEGVVAAIKKMNPDIIFLQEADIDSKRSAYIDQVQYILDNTDLNYGVYGSQWKSDFVPSDGIGRMNSGNAILSKYKLSNSKRIPLSLIESDPAIVKYFYLRRNLLTASANINGKEISLFGTHTSAYATDGTKLKQLKKIKDEVRKTGNNPFVLGGDFNTIPPNSVKFKDFDDDVCPKESGFASEGFEKELDDMKMFIDDYNQAITQTMYDADYSKYTSFTSDKNGFWNRKLDYIFTNKSFVDNTGVVIQSVENGGINTMPLSDHAPIAVKYIINQ